MAWPFYYKTLHCKSDSIDLFEFLDRHLFGDFTTKKNTHPWKKLQSNQPIGPRLQIRAPKQEPLDADELVLALEDQAGFPGSNSDFI